MDEDRSKGTGNKKLEEEGRMDKGEGKVQNKVGETKDEVRKHTP